MRRCLGGVLVMALLVPAVVASAGSENYRDDFGEISYSGSDGSLEWSDPWVESEDNDPEGGNDPAAGQIRVVDDGNCSNNKCLRIEGGPLAQLWISRKADLTGFMTADLSFDLEIDPALLSTATLAVQVRGNGSGWKTLKTYPLLLNDGSFEESFDVSSYIGADFELLFSLDNVLGGDDVYIDRVEIEGSVTPSTSTTSTTSLTTISVPTITVPTISVSTTSTTSAPTTSTTQPRVTTTTPRPNTTETEDPSSSAGEGATTTTTNPTASADLPIPPGDGGLRDPGVGLLADYRPGMMGALDFEGVEVLGAEINADFTIAVEVFEATKLWIAVLALLITTVLVSGLDRRRSKLGPG
ncbi:MAG TPA: hypothetical protein VMQ46_03435 [Acidimicrobiia bacterium]|nr:hypothetical protein [Acidimicrobiia bacterium]